MCNFETYNARELDNHVQSMHNKLISCVECDFEAASRSILKDHMNRMHTEPSPFACDMCEFKTVVENNFTLHLQNKHGKNQSGKSVNDPCIYWNYGHCRHGDRCRFAHEEIPACSFQDKCRKNQCPLYHYNKSLNNFLGRSQVRGVQRK